MASLDALEVLAGSITSERPGAFVDFDEPAEPDEPIESLDAFVAKRGMTPIGKAWRELTRDGAEGHLAYCLYHNLGTGAKVVPSDEAMALAAKVADAVKGARYFSNISEADAAQLRTGDPYTATSVSAAAINTGVAAVGRDMILLVWFGDDVATA